MSDEELARQMVRSAITKLGNQIEWSKNTYIGQLRDEIRGLKKMIREMKRERKETASRMRELAKAVPQLV